MSKPRFLQMSGAVVDLVYRVAAVPQAGEEVTSESCLITAGGGFNAVVAAQRAGMDVAYGGGHGTGLFAALVRQALHDAGIPVLQAQFADADQGNCVVIVDAAGERTFISKDGAEGILDADSIATIEPSDFDWILLSGYTLTYPESRDALSTWLTTRLANARFVFDPSPVVDQIPSATLGLVVAKARWISANAREATALTGIASPRRAADALLTMMSADARGAVVRCGGDGCWIALRGGQAVHLPGFVVDSVDTNGAGDAHVGAFIAALATGQGPVDAGRYANAAAALSTMQAGAATAPDAFEIEKFLNHNQSKTA